MTYWKRYITKPDFATVKPLMTFILFLLRPYAQGSEHSASCSGYHLFLLLLGSLVVMNSYALKMEAKMNSSFFAL